jgi:hypothetical protein
MHAIRCACLACLSGEKHRSHVLYGRHNGRRFAVYLPKTCCLHHPADNARALQDLQLKAGPRYVTALKRERASERKKGKVVARAAARQIRFADAELCGRPCAWSRCRRAFQRCNTSGRVLRLHLVNSSTIRSAW